MNFLRAAILIMSTIAAFATPRPNVVLVITDECARRAHRQLENTFTIRTGEAGP